MQFGGLMEIRLMNFPKIVFLEFTIFREVRLKSTNGIICLFSLFALCSSAPFHPFPTETPEVTESTTYEADYTLDDSFWNEENPVGEVERLLLEYRQNQELVRNIGAHYYQIIYPVQLRHHEKMGISTREVGAPKFPPREGGNAQSGYGNTSRSRSRTGKHFHRTSLLIKAFNHKFRLDLELNTQLLAPNLMQKHYLPSGAEQVSKQEIEHCYYHGTVKDYPGATAAFHTCNGVSGVIHVGNETFVIHPFYGGDLSKHPHVIFEARTKANKGCGLQGNTDWRTNTYRRTKHVSGGRFARDVSEATKYIETALVIDKAMFEKRNGSTRSEVVHDAIQVANIADLYFRTLNTRVSVVYIETWQDRNHASIEKGDDIGKALLNFIDYSSRQLYRVDKDTTQLLTGDNFKGGEAGISVPDVVCTPKSVGISVDVNPYELHLLAGTMAHMIGHNIGMSHDGGREECVCRDWHGCIMAQTIVGQENVQPYKFSECSRTDYNSALRTGHGICLLNKPNELETKRTCGNGIVEDGEDCDCGQIHDCQDQECCDPYTCKLRKDAQCATGPCCKNCTLKSLGTVCREATNECDLAEHCTGDMGLCPPDIHKKNGIECDNGKAHCFNGHCPTLNAQCDKIWGFGAKAGDLECFMQFNSKGSFNGHCGTDSEKNFIKCDNENARCGSLHCQHGSATPLIATDQHQYSTTIISIKGQEYECKTTSPTEKGHVQFSGLVLDGTPCGTNLICVNQTCTSLYPHVGTGKCPSNDNNIECSGNGVCSNINKCYCELGFEGPDCSQIGEYNPPILDTTQAPPGGIGISLEEHMKKKETPYGQNTDNLSTLMMVFIMVGVVKCVFICFASIAVCYRRTTMPKPDPPFIKKPGIAPKGLPAMASAPVQESAGLDNSTMLSFGNMPSYSGRDPQRVLYNRHNHMGAAPPTGRFQEHKMQQMKRLGVGSGSEDDPGHSGEEETVSFIDLPPNNLSKLPEKGILKKPCPFGGEDPCHKGKWLDDAQSDAQEMLSQSGDNLGADMLSSGPISEVERNLKSLNSYHEDILEALRTAASRHHGGSGPGSATASSDDLLRRSLAAAAALDTSYNRVNSQDKLCDPNQYPADHLLSRHGSQTHVVMVENNSPTPSGHHHHRRTNHRTDNQADDEEDEEVHPVGPIRIRNLEDLIRQLEHKTSRHMSPSGSEDIRMSETEADRHYNRLDSQGGRVRGTEFGYGRYRHGPGSSGSGRGYLPEEEGIYESADQDRPGRPPPDTPDSESDDFIQAQPRLVQLGSTEERVGYSPPESPVRHEDSPSPHNDQSALLPGPKYPEYKH